MKSQWAAVSEGREDSALPKSSSARLLTFVRGVQVYNTHESRDTEHAVTLNWEPSSDSPLAVVQ